MAKICDKCGRGGLMGNSRSHSNIATRRKQEINLQTRRIKQKTMRLCAKCVKGLAKA